MWSETTSPNCWGSQLSNQNEFRSVLLKLRCLESRRASSCEGQLSAFFYIITNCGQGLVELKLTAISRLVPLYIFFILNFLKNLLIIIY
jgi:hypothetical protein